MAGDSSLLSGCPFSPCACSHPSCGLLFFLHSQRPSLSPVSSGTPNKASGNTSSQRLSQMLADTLTFFLPFISQETMGLCTSCRRAPKFQRPVCPLHFALRVSQIQGLSLSRPSALPLSFMPALKQSSLEPTSNHSTTLLRTFYWLPHPSDLTCPAPGC